MYLPGYTNGQNVAYFYTSLKNTHAKNTLKAILSNQCHVEILPGDPSPDREIKHKTMYHKFLPFYLMFAGLFLLPFSCAEDISMQEEIMPTTEVDNDSDDDEDDNDDNELNYDPTSQDCDEHDAPGSNATQSCADLSRPLNVGRLDCRAETPAEADPAGYQEVDGFGVYTIYGGFTADTRRAVRIERRFKNYDREANSYATFRAKFKISELSTGHTYIAQTHGSQEVVGGPCDGRKHTSAMYLLRVQPRPGSREVFEVYVEESVEPFTQNGESPCRGERIGRRREAEALVRTINKDQEYELEINTGYDRNRNAFTEIRIDDVTFNVQHKFKTEEMYFRYGAYSARKEGPLSDRKSVVHFKDTEYCHPD